MFEYPGTQMGDDLYKNVQELRRWLSRFIPELEQQLDNLGVDNFTTAYNERVEGLTTLTGAPGSKTTAEAVAEHLLDRNNPHRVTLNQLGYQAPYVQAQTEDGSTIITLCGMMIQMKPVTISAATETASGSVYKRDVSAGDWEIEFEELYMAQPVITDGDLWAGKLTGATETSAGTLTVFSGASASGAGEAKIIGIGRV